MMRRTIELLEAASVSKPVSLQDILRRRQQAGFVGRDGHLELFRENLRLPVEHQRKRFIFNIHGDGGVGKTFLLRQLRRIAIEEGALDAHTDEYIYGIPETMATLASQLGEPFRNFLSKYQNFDQRREQIAQDPHAPLAMWSKVTRAAVSVGLNASRIMLGGPPIVDLIGSEAAAAATDEVRGYLSQKFSDSEDVRLLLNPVEELSPAFLEGLREAAVQQPVTLFFDTYESTAPVLDGWLLDVLAGRFGDLPAALVLIIAGRDPLGASGWTDFLDAIAAVPLLPFTETETRQLLSAKGVTAEPVVQTVLTLSGGLPLLVAMLAEGQPMDPLEIGDPSGTAVERFLKWEHDPQRREAVLLGALPRQIDADVLAALLPDMEGRSTLEWLQALPFVAVRSGRFQYHEVVRTPMLRIQRAQSAQSWRAAHQQLAEAHQRWRDQVPAVDWSDPAWLHHRLEETYHRLCWNSVGTLPSAVDAAVEAAIDGLSTARRWAEMIRMAGRDSGNDRVQQRGERLLACLDEQRLDCVDVLTELLSDASLTSQARINALIERGRLHYFADREEEAIGDFSQAIQLEGNAVVAFGRRGECYRWLKRYELALEDFNHAIDLDPRYAWAIGSRGETYRMMGLYDEALADYNRAIDLEPQNAWMVADRGETYRMMGLYDEALADYNRAIDLDPENVSTLGSRAQVLRSMDRYDEALSDFNRAIDLEPDSAWMITSRGGTYQLIEQYEDALADFNRAIDLNPKSAWAVTGRGVTYQLMSRYEEALSEYDRAIELDPNAAFPFVGRGNTFRLTNRHEEALANLTRAIDLDPKSAFVFVSRGQAYREMKEYEEAVADFNRALDLDPNSGWTIANRGITYHLMKRYEEALADFTRAIDIDPEKAFVLAGRGQIYCQMEQYEEAVADFNRAIELEPESTSAFCFRGETYHAMEQYEEAVADFNRAVDLDPEFEWAIVGRGETYREMGRYDDALADFTRAIDLDARSKWAIVGRGETYRQMGRYDDALADFNFALDLDSNFEWAIASRGKLYREMGRYDDALADFNRVIDLDPNDPWYFAYRWRTNLDLGRKKEAEADLARAREIDTSRDWNSTDIY